MERYGAAEMVREFHESFRLPMSDTPRTPGLLLAGVRSRMLLQEVRELGEAVIDGELPEIAQELADCVYVLYGTALTYGIDLDEVLAEVHRANMTKSHGDTVDGKVQKGEAYRKPDVAAVLERQAEKPTDEGVHYCAEHRLTISHYLSDRSQTMLHYELKHPAECDRLPYNMLCQLDLYGNDRTGWPDEIGEYVISAWTSKTWTDTGWEYDSGVDWDHFVTVSATVPDAEVA